MSHNRDVKSIRCTSCGAPLTLHGGGHKVRTLNCDYCGAVMDVHKEFKILAKFNRAKTMRPECPLDLGMQGEIQGIEFTIIGMVGWKSVYGDTWIDLLLFSPTHGYTWLSYNDGHYVFSRRIRDIPDRDLTYGLEPKRDKVIFSGREYLFFERYNAEITYVAGELTWLAKVGDKTQQSEAIDPPFLLSSDKRKKEREFYVGEYLDAAYIHEQFAASDELPEKQGIHPAQPYSSPKLRALGKAAQLFTLITMVVGLLIFFMMGGHNILSKHITSAQLQNKASYTTTFEVTKPRRLIKLRMLTDLNNAWSYFEVEVNKDGKNILGLGKEVSFYSGYDGEHWSEGDSTTTALFRVPEAGTYELKVTQVEGGQQYQQNPPAVSINLLIYQGYVSPRYFFYLGIISLILAAFYLYRRYRFETKRWADVMDD